MTNLTEREMFNSATYEEEKLLRIMLTQPYRHYHNLQHCVDVLNYSHMLYLRVESKIETSIVTCFDILSTAARWHDAIYEPFASDNETRSAQMYWNMNNHKTFKYNRVFNIIEATRNHFEYNGDNLLQQVFLDADLYELGSPWELFEHNYNLIKLEFIEGFMKGGEKYFSSRYLEDVFEKRRKVWLESIMVLHPKIFKIATEREERARNNIKRQLENLEKRLP